MAKSIPASLWDSIKEEPERFLSYLDKEKIWQAKNPHKEFMQQFSKEFGQKQGLNLWQYAENHYKLFNFLFKQKEMQSGLSKGQQGPLSRTAVKSFFRFRDKEVIERQKRLDESLKETRKVEPGKIKIFKWKENNRYSNFILRRSDYTSNKKLADEFNQTFGTKLSTFSIRDKKYRLLGKK